MQYMGGKARTANQIAGFLISLRENRTYLEPFFGGGWVGAKIQGGSRVFSDYNADLMLMWRRLSEGWVPPDSLTEAEYKAARALTNDPLKAFAGFGCSFAGKWFGGYARSGKRNYASNARNSLIRKRSGLIGAEFVAADYRAFNPKDCLIYCDPPYAGTTGYSACEHSFSWSIFWDTIRVWSACNTVIVSEYAAPEDFSCVMEVFTKTDMRVAGGIKEPRIERLFIKKEKTV